MVVKVLTYNIHKGFSSRNRRFILDDIRTAIRLSGADIVLLQEVVGAHAAFSRSIRNWSTTTQLEYLADEVWTDHVYANNAVYDDGHHGNAILSRYPIESHENIDLSVGRGEKRGMLFAKVRISGGRRLHCYCTHLSLSRKDRRKQYRRIVESVRSGTPPDVPVLVGGDFNDWTGAAKRHLEQPLQLEDMHRIHHRRAARTFPSSFPLLALDRLYAKHVTLKEITVLRGRPWARLSDHLPLYAELECG